MAFQYYPATQLVDFSSLAELPKRAEEARLRDVRQSLGNINLENADSVLKGATEAIRKGDIEAALKLGELGRKMKESENLSPLVIEQIKRLYGGGGGPAAAPSNESAPTPVTPPADTRFGPNPLAPQRGPMQQSELPVTPEEEMAAFASAGGQGPVPQGIQVASAVPGLPTGAVPQQAPPPVQTAQAGPGGVSEAVDAYMKTRPALGGVGAPPQIPPQAAPRQGQTEAGVSTERLGKLMGIVAIMGKKNPGPIAPAIQAEIRAELQKGAYTPAQKELNWFNADRLARGMDPLSPEEYKFAAETSKPRFEELVKRYGPYAEQGMQAEQEKQLFEQLDLLSKNRKLVTGVGAESMGDTLSMLNTAKNMAVALGVPASVLPEFKNIQTIKGLQDAYKSLASQIVIARFSGKLGQGVSNKDIGLMESATNALALIDPANKVLSEAGKALADHKIALAKVARDYRSHPSEGRGGAGYLADAPGLDEAIAKYNRDNPIFFKSDGTPTDLGKRLQEEIAKVSASAGGYGTVGPAVSGIKNFLGQLPGLPTGAPTGPAPDVTLPPMAKGGPVKAGKPYMVGEKGPETYMPERQIMPHHEGKVYYSEKTGKPMGRIKGGRCVPFGRGS